MHSYDIIVIGSGPAGTSTVLELLRLGIGSKQILMLDRSDFPRDKLCGGGITSRGWERLQRWQIAPEKCWEAEGILLLNKGKGQLLKEPGRLATADRKELDFAMLKRCQALGIKWHKAVVDRIQRVPAGWLVATADQEYRAQYLVGADGYASLVRRAAGLSSGRGGKLLELSLPCKTEQKPLLEMEFSPVHSGVAGYLWRFPYIDSSSGQAGIKYGIMDRSGKTPTADLRQLLQNYLVSHGESETVPSPCPGYPERYFVPFARQAGKHWILVGDAAGIDPLLGEGLAVSFEQAELAAKALKNALRRGTRISRWYNVRYPFTAVGWNHWFLKKLGDFVYGRFGILWLQILTGDGRLPKLSQSRRFGGYGRFGRHGLLLTWIILSYPFYRMLHRKGIASAESP